VATGAKQRLSCNSAVPWRFPFFGAGAKGVTACLAARGVWPARV